MSKVVFTHADIQQLVRDLFYLLTTNSYLSKLNTTLVYPIPRGGVPVVYALQQALKDGYRMLVVDTPEEAEIFIDDLVDSGETKRYYMQKYRKPFFSLIEKGQNAYYKDKWIVFPWEKENEESGIEDNIRRLLQYVGEDPNRGGLLETPKRVAKAWAHWTSGYNKSAGEILKVFEDGAENYDQMVVVRDLPIYSHCEHHLAAIIGTASIAYIPNGRIVGLSKLSRLAEMFARRLQVQERLTNQIADALVEHLSPIGVGVIIRARHLCMESRGICQQGHHTVTTALRGAILDDAQARSEFLKLVE